TAVRLGIVTFFIPFFFVYQPALLGRGDLIDVVFSTLSAIIGVIVLASALEGYLIGYGKMGNLIIRATFLIAGVLMFVPNYLTDVIGLIIVVVLMSVKKATEKKPIQA